MFHTMKCKEHDHSSFFKFLQMEQNHKNTDCYFFYYSKCSKGDTCAFRHEPSALGCETVCSYWQQGNCLNEHCNFRHMELKKNRKSIACYWETQPSGCMKPHCPFLHRNERPGIESSTPINQGKTPETISAKPTNQEWSNRQEDSKFDGSSTESDQGRGSSEAGSFIGSPVVDPLIVNFEEGTLSLPSSTLRIPGSLSIPGLSPTSLNIPAAPSATNNHLSVPPPPTPPNVQNSQSSSCSSSSSSSCHLLHHHHHHHQALSFPHHRPPNPNLHHHHHHHHHPQSSSTHGPSLSSLQNPAPSSSPFLQRPSSPLLQRPSSPLLQRPPSSSPIHRQPANSQPQPATSRFTFPYLGFASYPRF